MSKIQSKVHKYGNECESEWPPRFPEKDNSGAYYWDRDKQEFVEGYPPNPNNQFGEAPIVMFDTMPPLYHEGACRTIESRKEWEMENKAHGMLSFSSHDEVKRHTKKGTNEQQDAIKKDRRNAAKIAREVWKSDPRHQKQKLVKQAEQQMATLKESGVNLSDSGIKIKD